MKQRKTKPLKTQREWAAMRSAERYSSLRDLNVSYEGHSDTIVTRLPDISTKGMFINTTRAFPEGAVLNVHFRLAHTGADIRSRCEVRYCLDGVGIGVEFVDISPEAAAAIERELRPGARSTSNNSQRHPSSRQRTRKTGKSRKTARKRRRP
jgi:hypothetical protein